MPGLEVVVEQGKLKGCQLVTGEGFQYNGYLGIPYAKPPLGELRFRDPQYPNKWKGILDATKEGSDGSQIDILFGKGYLGSENSLFLNIYVPKAIPDYQKLPVMLWIHGGGFAMGSGSREIFGVDYLIQTNVIVVTINYRLGPLGFLCCNNKEVPGNAGLKDQIFALRWVQKNIHNFNGDPDNVTIFGESAGGASVHYHMMSPMAKGLFHKAIIQSGSSTSIWATQRHPENNVFTLAKALGYENSNDMDATLKFLRRVPVEKLMKAGMKNVFIFEEVHFVPTIEQKIAGVESFITTDPIELMMSGNYNRVPCITGVTSQEGAVVLMNAHTIIKDFKSVKHFSDTGFILSDLLQSLNMAIDAKTAKLMAEKIEEFYFRNSSEPIEGFIDVISDLFFINDVFRNINLQSKFNPVYAYVLSYNGGLNLLRFLTSYPYKGAAHIDDLGYLFKPNLEIDEEGDAPPKVTHEDILTINRLVTMWTNFAKYGNPTPKLLDNIITTTWEPVKSENVKCLEIGRDLKMISNPFAERIKFWTDLMK